MNIFIQFYKSLYSPKTIARTRFQKIGKTIAYVFFLAFISSIPAVIIINSYIMENLESVERSLKVDFPDFSIEDGSLVLKEQNNFVETTSDNFHIILDETGDQSDNDLAMQSNVIAFLDDSLVVKVEGNQVFNQSYVYFLDNYTKDDIIDILHQLNNSKWIIIILASLMYFILNSFMKFLAVTFLALFGNILKQPAKKAIKFSQVWTISAYSITITTVFFTIMEFLKTPVQMGVFIGWTVNFIILYLSIKEIPSKKQRKLS
ncbi:DUF1189 domain-containing protein [Bacillus carboniphilus]|uniref:DUF1189 domain-containing protein n=1 Tax=Bacillus carboniphilus TaxID=86663 RepID=A0ABY9JX21_9BACI|nr:DUF1189 domain-containing protein [Bacillus carboniphilus]WLR43957.1 DUF1189 domain-containing protein [Bacillus carboniphilus]